MSDEIDTGRSEFVGRLIASRLKREGEKDRMYQEIKEIQSDAEHLASGLDGQEFVRAESIILACARLQGFLEEMG